MASNEQLAVDRIAPHLEWLPLASAIASKGVGCIDGRRSDCGLGVAGGNAGEAVLLLTVAESHRGAAYTADEIQRVVDALGEALGRLNMHTDDAAVAALAEKLDVSVDDAARWVADGPPAERRDEVLDAVAHRPHVGCGHMATILASPEPYGVRPSLARDIIRALHRRAWAGDATLDVLHGAHREEALLVFDAAEPLSAETAVPVLCESPDQFFSNHDAMLAETRRRSVAVLAASDSALASVDNAALAGDIETLGRRHLELTLEALAPTLPRYRLRFAADRTLTIDSPS